MCRRVFLEKLAVVKLVTKGPVFCRIQTIISMFTTAHHRSLPHIFRFTYLRSNNEAYEITTLSVRHYSVCVLINNVTYLGFSIHDGTLLHSKSQYTTVKHSWKLFENTYTSDLYGPGVLIPIGFFQQDLSWQSSNTRSHSCSQKASKHTSGQSIVGLSVHLHTTTALRRIVHH
jgi:hypothetical protein